MGNRPRSQSERRHEHTDFSGEVHYIGEEDLYSLIDGSERPPLVLILDGIQDPHNLGACLRTADAAGVTGVIIPKDRSVSVTAVARTVACGAAERVPIARVTNLARSLRQLKELGLWLLATGDEETRSLYEVDMTGPLGIVIGAEGTGVRRLTRELCDHLVRIPMQGSVSCLNLSVAAGVTLFEAVRQRQAKL